MLLEVRDQLSRSGVVNSDLAIPLFDSLLRVAMADVSSSAELPEEKPDRVSGKETPMNTKKNRLQQALIPLTFFFVQSVCVLTVCLFTGFHPELQNLDASLRSNLECFIVTLFRHTRIVRT